MYEVRIPDQVYKQAAQAAEAQHVSLEQFVTEAVQIHLQDEDAAVQQMFTPERLAHIEKADAEIDEGKFFTADQVDEHFVQKHKAWLQNHPR